MWRLRRSLRFSEVSRSRPLLFRPSSGLLSIEERSEVLKPASQPCLKSVFCGLVGRTPTPSIFGETARPHPHAIAAVVLDVADFDLACVRCKALKWHIGDNVLRPGDVIGFHTSRLSRCGLSAMRTAGRRPG